jgi:hypothetical protein
MKFYQLFIDGKYKSSINENTSDLKEIKNFTNILNSIKRAQLYLSKIKIEDLITWLDKVSLAWSDRESLIQKHFSNQGINFLILWFSKKHLMEITNFAFRGNRNFLDDFISIDENKNKLKAQPRGIVSHWIAGNVPMLGMLSLVQGILTKNANIVKVSKENLQVVPMLLESMSKINIKGSNGKKIEGKKIVQSIACIYYSSSDDEALKEMSLNSKVRVAWGGMEAVEKIMNLPRKFGCEDIIFGPKTSFAVIGAEKLRDKNIAIKIARKVALDASQFEQQGCNSPHTVFVEKNKSISPMKFAKLLSNEMNTMSKKIIRDPNTVVDTGKILMLRAQHEMKGEAFYPNGLDWTILYSEKDKGLAEPCYYRTLFVRPILDVMKVEEYCSHLTQTAGVALSDKRKKEFALRVSAKGIDRIPDVGSMSNYDVPWDGMFVMDRLIRWCKI